MGQKKLVINHLDVSVGNTKILKNVSFCAKTGDIVGILGPNGAGKSTLLKTIMHHFNTKVTNGSIVFNDKELTNLSTDQIANLGVFYISQHPTELEGVGMLDFLKVIYTRNNEKYSFSDMYLKVTDWLKQLDLSEEILTRNVNVGFSGGQKKKSEIMQMSLFNLSLILLDELDSGLDVDTTKKIVKKIRNNRQSVITIVISHQTDFLQMLQPNKVLILANGQIVKQGDNKLVNLVAKTGFKSLVKASEDNVFVKEDPFRVCHR